jgi:hypothetical protein
MNLSTIASEVVETGLYNLTKDESPCLIHFGKDKSEQWLLVRMKKPDSAGSSGGTSSDASGK